MTLEKEAKDWLMFAVQKADNYSEFERAVLSFFEWYKKSHPEMKQWTKADLKQFYIENGGKNPDE